MILVDDAPMAVPLIFDELAAQHEGLFTFDWDAQFAAASEPVEPWQWEWRSPLRALQQQLIGTSDVTGWTAEAGRELAAILSEPVSLHPTLLDFREAETGLLPAVDTVSAEGAKRLLPPL